MTTRLDLDELAVLNALGSRLTSLRSPGEVLHQVAVEARRLLGVDVAYIMLARDDGPLRIEVADGTLGAALQGIEIPAGGGLGGRVMQTGEPMWSADYLSDQSIRHLRAVDSALTSERLGGIVGVPLLVGGEPIGVLFAADRAPRPFADREVVLLAALAAHAAVALHNARLFEGYERATAELTRSVELHDRLARIAVRGGGPGELVAALADVLEADVAFLAPDGRVLAGRDGRPRVTAPVLVGDDLVGLLAVSGAEPPAVHLLETGCTVLALVVATERAVAEAERRAAGELVTALFSGRLHERTVRRRARLAGVDLDAVRCVAVLEPDEGAEAATAVAAGRLGGWAAEHDGRWVILSPEADPGQVRSRLRTIAPCTAGVARSPGGPAGVRAAYEEAAGCVSLLRALGRPGACALPDELGVYRALLREAGRDELRRFIDATAGPLLSSADLVCTAEAYLSRFRAHAATSQALHIHPNTLYKRLRRITDLLGDGWDGPDQALELHLALRLNRLAAQPR